MQRATSTTQWMAEARFIGPARVVRRLDGRRAEVELAGGLAGEANPASIAMPEGEEPRAGDTALVVGDPARALYVIGVLERRDPPEGSADRVRLADGARAESGSGPCGETLRVFSPDSTLLFEYDASTGTARVHASDKLEFHCADGSIDFKAAGGIRFEGERVEVEGRSGARLGAGAQAGPGKAAVSVAPGHLSLQGSQLKASSSHAEWVADETEFTSETVRARTREGALVAERLETTVGTWIQRAESIYCSVEQVLQRTAGRMRTIVRSTYWLKTRRSRHKADKDVRIDGEKIHLG